MTTINLYRSGLAACLELAGNKDVRGYLNGVAVELNGDAGIVLTVATDGHALGCYDHKAANHGALPECLRATIIIPRDVVANALKITPKKAPFVELEVDGDRTTLAAIPFAAIDGTFPDWRRVVPKQYDADALCAMLNPALLARIAKAGKHIAGRSEPAVYYPADRGSAVLFIYPDYRFFAIAMGLRITGGYHEAIPANEALKAAGIGATLCASEPA